MSVRKWVLIVSLLLAVILGGCQASEPETIEVEVTRIVEVAAEHPEPETVEVTRVVEVPVDVEVPVNVEVTRVVEVPAEQIETESPSFNPMMPVEFDTFESSATGREYVITVVLPLSYMFSDANYPVIYVSDGDFYAIPLGVAAGQLAFGQEVQEFITVGIDYGNPNPMEWLELRELDMGPGGSEQFLRFFEEELIPYIESTYRADPANRTLAGHSSGGNFALYGLLNAADTFNNFIASSPSGAGGLTFMLESFAANQGEMRPKLYLSVGDLDAEVIAHVQTFNDALVDMGIEGLDYEMAILDNETHLSVRPRAFNNALRWLFGQG